MDQMTIDDNINDEPQDPTGGESGSDEIGDPSPPDDDTQDLAGDKPKKKGGVQKKIDKLTREKYTAQQEAQFYKDLAMKGGQQTQDPNQFNKPEPKEEDFSNYSDWVKAQLSWEKEKLRFEFDQERKTERQSQTRATVQAQFGEARKKHEDFDEVALNTYLPINEAMNEAAMGENYAEILYELGSNPEKAAHIAAMPPLQAAREIGKIEAKITSKPRKTQTTNAPETFDQISSGGSPTIPKGIEKMSRKERFATWEDERLKGRGG